MAYLIELKEDFALQILKELAKANALTLKKVPDSSLQKKEDAATLNLMAEADFEVTASEEKSFSKLQRP